MKKKRGGWLLLLLCCMLLSSCVTTPKSADTPTWQEQYDLGVRYLEEGNYEEAIIAFTAAIEIDPMERDAYLGKAEAYMRSGNAEQAEATLNAGLTLLGEDDEMENALAEIHANSIVTEEEKAMLNQFIVAFESDPQQAVDLMELYGGSFIQDDGETIINEELAELYEKTQNKKRLAFDGSAFHADWTGTGLVNMGGSMMYSGALKNGLPDGHGVLLAIDTWYSAGGISASWTECDWIAGTASGSARIRDYYSSNWQGEDDFQLIQDITCTFGEGEIMTQGEVNVLFQSEGQQHRFVYRVENGKVNWSTWQPGYQSGELSLPCVAHSNCGTTHDTRNQGKELFQNTHKWIYKEIPRELQHYALYGIGGTFSG